MTTHLSEVWLRGPVEGVPALLQPLAHALLQSVEEIQKMLQDFPSAHLWERPAGVASAGFHLQHIPGVLDRLSTYALGKSLSAEQMSYLQKEGKETAIATEELVAQLEKGVHRFIEQLKHTDPASLTAYRSVGRKALPSTVIGLLFHAAEHTMRHTGQLLVTVKMVQQKQ